MRTLQRAALLLCMATMVAGVPGPARAQGSKVDYERAGRLREMLRDKVLNERITPHWLEGGRFWYRLEGPGGTRQWIGVEPDAARKEPLFDHARLAAALSEKLGREIAADRLPIERLESRDGRLLLLLSGESRPWTWDNNAATLTREEGAAANGLSLSPRRGPARSRRTGEETAIVVVNRTAGELRLVWRDDAGKPHEYGTVAPGAERRQHTFEGHAWELLDSQRRRLGLYEASREPAVIVIDADRKPDEQPQTRPAETSPTPAPVPEGRSPDGRWRAFCRAHDVVLRNLKDDTESAITTDGSADDAYVGEALWSPDSSRFAIIKRRKGDDRKVYYVESSPGDQLQPKLHSYDYLKPGDRVPVEQPVLFDPQTRQALPADVALYDNPWDITRPHWTPDGREFRFLYNQRGHQALRLVGINAAGKVRAIIDERSKTFVDYAGKFYLHEAQKTDELIWMSERDGWNHLYLYDGAAGQVKNQITRGEWVVREVDRVDEEKRQVWFRAGGIRPGQDPYYIHYCRVNFDGTGLTILTEGDGTHHVDYSPDGRYLIDTWSRVDLAPVTELRRASDGSLACELVRADDSALRATGWKPPERFVAKGRDGRTDICGVIWRPLNHDPAKKYPIIECIYAGPQDSFVPKSFSPFHGPRLLAELGFILVQIDGMGTSNRSKAFHDVCAKNLGDAGYPDRIAWIKAAAAKDASMDLSRIGIYGGSAGGQNAMRALLDHGNFYKVAVADCGCHDNRVDKIWWNELWMGWPVGPAYEASSNVVNAHKLQGKLLLIVGEKDENVDPASTLQVVNALIKADKDFDLLVMTGAGHGAAETPYGQRRRADYFVRHLLGVEPRHE